jgi:hypothetical protein
VAVAAVIVGMQVKQPLQPNLPVNRKKIRPLLLCMAESVKYNKAKREVNFTSRFLL